MTVECPSCRGRACVVELDGGQWYAVRCQTPACPNYRADVVYHSETRGGRS